MRSPHPTVLSVVLLGLCVSSGSCAGEMDRRAKTLKQAKYHYQLGSGYYQDNRLAQSMAQLLEALELNPGHTDAHLLMGAIHMARREFYDAVEHLQRAVDLRPNFYEARNNLGVAYLALCRWEDAASLYRDLIREPLYLTPWMSHNNLGWALWKLDRRKEAVRHYKRSVFFNARFCVAYNNLGMAYLEESRYEDAERALRKALAADEQCSESYAEPHLHLARLFERTVRSGDACEQLAECVRKAPPEEGQVGVGCGHSPVGLRCERKARQLNCAPAG